MATNPSDSGSYTCGHTPVRWTKFDILRQTAIPSPIIFTTAYDEYAIQAFKYNSFDYLLKPINSEELAEAINKVRRRTLSDTHGEDMRRLVEYMYRNNYRYRERFLLPYRDGYISVQVKTSAISP